MSSRAPRYSMANPLGLPDIPWRQPAGLIPGYHHTKPQCPNLANHAWRPEGYGAFIEFCREMSKTHRQERCPECGYYVIWTPIVDPQTEHLLHEEHDG